MNAIWIVAKRELKTRLMSKASIISTLIFVVLIAGGLQVVGYFLNSGDSPATMIGVSQENETIGDIASTLSASTGDEVASRVLPEDNAKDLLISGEIEMFIGGEPGALVLMFDGTPDASLVSLVGDAAQQYTTFSEISPEEAEKLHAALLASSLDVVDVNPVTASRDLDGIAIVTAFVLIALLFFALIQSASLIIVGVIEEKASRVVEILLATIRPSQLLAGKVLGIGIMALIQVALFGAAGIASATAAGLVDLSAINLSASIFQLLGWFFLGFAIYVSLFGGLAALVSRQEDAGAVTTPLIFGMMIPFYLAIYLIPNAPDATATKVLSFIPFFAPFMMPVRSAFDAAGSWEVWTAVALCLITIPLVIWIGGRIYSRAVLQTGGRVKLRDALRG